MSPGRLSFGSPASRRTHLSIYGAPLSLSPFMMTWNIESFRDNACRSWGTTSPGPTPFLCVTCSCKLRLGARGLPFRSTRPALATVVQPSVDTCSSLLTRVRRGRCGLTLQQLVGLMPLPCTSHLPSLGCSTVPFMGTSAARCWLWAGGLLIPTVAALGLLLSTVDQYSRVGTTSPLQVLLILIA